MNKKQLLQSQTLDFLRFPLIVGVVFIHTRIVDGGGEPFDFAGYAFCREFFSDILARVAVPMFFFISGLLFFLNVEKFDLKTYFTKLRSRVKTLLIPYLFWNILVFFLLVYVLKTAQIDDVYYALWGGPAAFPFWFIRNLMVVVVLSPAIFLLVKHLKTVGIAALLILWFFGLLINVKGFSPECIAFFAAGTYFGINKINIVECFGRVKNISFVIYPLFVVAYLLVPNPYLLNAGICLGIVFFFNLCAGLLKSGKIGVSRFLSAASFFVFATHNNFFLPFANKLLMILINPRTDVAVSICFFLKVAITVGFALIFYWIMKRLFPKFTGVITGGR
jgi:hypothetical protein